MRAHEILFESDYGDKKSRSKPLTVDQFNKLRPKIEVALQKAEQGVKIYRGVRISRDRYDVTMMYTNPTRSERVSANTSNELTLLISRILPSWQNWPKRSRSLICSGDYDYAEGYSSIGKPFIVLPIGNPNIGVVSDRDFWDGFNSILPSPSVFNDLFRQFLKVFNEVFERNILIPRNNMDVELLKSELKVIDHAVVAEREKMLEVLKEYKDLLDTSYSIWSQDYPIMVKMLASGDAIKSIDKYYSPTINGFKLVPLSQLEANNNELWFSAPAVLIHPDQFDELIKTKESPNEN